MWVKFLTFFCLNLTIITMKTLKLKKKNLILVYKTNKIDIPFLKTFFRFCT